MKKLQQNGFIYSLLVGLVFFTACNNNATIVTIPILTTTDVSNLTPPTGTSGGTIISDGGSVIISRGVCWSTASNPTISDRKTSNETGTGVFSSTLTGLSADSTYFVRAYAINSAGVGYGNVVVSKITDIDGNVYHKVTIGTQTWMVENLRTTRYRTGEGITNDSSAGAWKSATYGAWCDYNNVNANGLKFGKLYNWFAINDSKNIAPVGWHVATDAEWAILVAFLGGESNAGAKLKEVGDKGFAALLGGYRSPSGSFAGIGESGFWWTSTLNNSSSVFFWEINLSTIYRLYNTKQYGHSVRFIMD